MPDNDDLHDLIENLENRNANMAFLIGMIHGGLVEILNTPGQTAIIRGKLITLNDMLNDKIVKLFYKDEINENEKSGV